MDWTLFISVLALLISGISAIFAYRANQKSININELQTRPYLILSIAKNEATGRFFDIIEKGGNILWQVNIIVENSGTTPANNIKFPQYVNLKDNITVDKKMSIPIENFVLGQGQKYRYMLEIGGQVQDSKNIQEQLNQFKINNKPIDIKFKVLYTGLIDREKEYSSIGQFHIESNNFSILNKSNYN